MPSKIKLYVFAFALTFAMSFVSRQCVAQEFNLNCFAQASLAATQHQCQSQNRFVCGFEKLAVGYQAYSVCASQKRFVRRQKRFQRRFRPFRRSSYDVCN